MEFAWVRRSDIVDPAHFLDGSPYKRFYRHDGAHNGVFRGLLGSRRRGFSIRAGVILQLALLFHEQRRTRALGTISVARGRAIFSFAFTFIHQVEFNNPIIPIYLIACI